MVHANEVREKVFARIRAAETGIRDHMTQNERLRSRVIRRDRSWDVVIAALDVIGDTTLAVESYVRAPAASSFGDGGQYLRLYGVLQALVIQQDAVARLLIEIRDHVVRAASFDRDAFRAVAALIEARNLRHMVAGHPTLTRAHGQEQAGSHQVARMSLGSGRLMIHSYYGGARKPAVRHVDAPDVARAQEGVVADALEQARTALDADERSHRARYRNVKLIDLVPTFRGGVLRVGGHAGESAEAAVAAIRRAIGAFQRELAKRGMPAGRNHFVRLEVEDLQRALDGLRSERKVTRSRLTKLAKALARFQSVCREIDERYASDIIR